MEIPGVVAAPTMSAARVVHHLARSLVADAGTVRRLSPRSQKAQNVREKHASDSATNYGNCEEFGRSELPVADQGHPQKRSDDATDAANNRRRDHSQR